MDNRFPLELLTTARELKKYNENLYDFVKGYGFYMKPSSVIFLNAIPGFFMIYIIDKNIKYNQKYITNCADLNYIAYNIDYYYSSIKWENEFKTLKETAATKE